MKQEPNSRGLGIPRLQAGEQVNGKTHPVCTLLDTHPATV